MMFVGIFGNYGQVGLSWCTTYLLLDDIYTSDTAFEGYQNLKKSKTTIK